MFAALLILAQAAPAPVPAPITTALSPEGGDARCVAAFSVMASSDQPDVQRASQLGALYFYGKLVGRRPGLDLSPVLLEAARTVALNVKGELSRCGAELGAAGTAMETAGRSNAPPTSVQSPTPVRPRR